MAVKVCLQHLLSQQIHPIKKNRCQLANPFKNYFTHLFNLITLLKMCSGDHSAEKSFVCLSKFCILCCLFEVLCNNFHIRDSDQFYSKETPLSLFHSASLKMILLWRILCVTSFDLLKNVFWKALS